MAERVGCEPTNELPHCWFSRPVLSTAQPPLRFESYLDLLTNVVLKTELKFIFISLLSSGRIARDNKFRFLYINLQTEPSTSKARKRSFYTGRCSLLKLFIGWKIINQQNCG